MAGDPDDGAVGFEVRQAVRAAFAQVERDALAIVFRLAITRRDDFALLRLFLRGVGDDDPADFLFAFFDALNDDAVV